MSSTGPIPQPGGEFLVRSMDVVRQQQQEIIQKLTLAQQQAAKSVADAAKASPAPRVRMEVLQAKVSDQLTTLTTTLQRQQQTLQTLKESYTKEAYTKEAFTDAFTKDAYAAGARTAVAAGMSFAQLQGALELRMAELQASQEQMNNLMTELQTQNTQDMLKLQMMMQNLNLATQMISTLMKTTTDTLKSVVQKMV